MDKEEILANFQQITTIENIEICIAHLESTGWDLEQAIHLSLDSNESDIISTAHNEQKSNVSIQATSEMEAGPSTSKEVQLIFIIHFKNSPFKIQVSEHRTINDLKQLIMKRTTVPICRQLLKWPNPSLKESPAGSIVLKSLNLSSETNIELTDLTHEGFMDDITTVSPIVESTYQLRIKYTNENRSLNLNFPGSKTVLDIKNDLNAVLKLPVRFQQWNGWPANARNETKLSELGIEPIHSLELTNTSKENDIKINNTIEIDSDSDSIDEFEDAINEDIFTESAQNNRLSLLIENHIDDEILGCLQFINNYRERYGHGPGFFEGSLDDALKTACCSKSVKDRKLLAVYLHHDQSVLSNVFCGQLLGNENIIKLLNENYILYGWDLTCDSNKNMFLSSLTACVNDSTSLQIRNLAVSQFPIIIIIRKYRSVCEVADIIHGNINGDELYIHLMMNSDAFSEQMKIEIREENERNEREVLMQEQQRAYQESLLADRAKEEEKMRIEKIMESERQKQESERLQIEAKKEADRKNAENTLPPEPQENSLHQVSKIRFRKPTGEYIERRFTVDSQLWVLLNFATANGFSPTEFKIISSFPRKDLTLIDPNETLKNLNLYPQETLTLEER